MKLIDLKCKLCGGELEFDKEENWEDVDSDNECGWETVLDSINLIVKCKNCKEKEDLGMI